MGRRSIYLSNALEIKLIKLDQLNQHIPIPQLLLERTLHLYTLLVNYFKNLLASLLLTKLAQ